MLQIYLVEQKVRTLKVSKDFLNEVACNEELTKKDYRIFLFLLTQLDDLFYTKVSQRKICAELFIDKSSVSKALSNLVLQHIIERDVVDRDKYRFRRRV